VAQQSGVNVTGHRLLPPALLTRTGSSATGHDIAELLIRDISVGIADTGVRGCEIGWDREMSAAEEKSFRAAARAHLETGVTISTHAARWPVGLPQLDLLESEGVPAARVIVGHCDMVPDRAYHRALAERGAWVEFDTIQAGNEYTQRTLRSIHELVAAGFAERILLSQDVT
jgi:phosphotriesterase-related protein